MACALTYAKCGVAGLFIVDVNMNALESVAADCRKVATNSQFRVVTKRVDVSKEADVVDMTATFVSEFGRLDYAANVAGVIILLETKSFAVHTSTQIGESPKPLAECDVADFERVHRVNVLGVFLCMREEIKAMLKQDAIVMVEGRSPTRGAIVNMGSIGRSLFSSFRAP